MSDLRLPHPNPTLNQLALTVMRRPAWPNPGRTARVGVKASCSGCAIASSWVAARGGARSGAGAPGMTGMDAGPGTAAPCRGRPAAHWRASEDGRRLVQLFHVQRTGCKRVGLLDWTLGMPSR